MSMTLLPSVSEKDSDKEICVPGAPPRVAKRNVGITEDNDLKPLQKSKKAQPNADVCACAC